MLKRLRQHRVSAVIGFIALVLGCLIPVFVTSPYYVDLLIIVMVNAALAMAFIMMLRAGLINLGIAAFWGFGGYVSALLAMKLHLSVWLSMPLAAVITAVLAVALGYVLIGSGSSGFTFVILSSVVGMLLTPVVGSIDSIGGYSGLSQIPRPGPLKFGALGEIDFTSKASLFYLALFLLIVIIVVLKAFYSAWTGRAWNAIALNSRLAESVGVDVFRYRLMSFVVGSALVGLIGAFYAHYGGYLSPNTFGIWQNINIQIFAILGGIGFPVAGPILGAGLMALLTESMREVKVAAPAVQGAILILLVLFLPTGLLGLLRLRGAAKEKGGQVYYAASLGLNKLFKAQRP
ncbi:MAG: branched-chain amino acid ABC transporter permease [Thermoleophilia bacterium]|nr:branched-chain amino acid ABC transporter permease [Thermoleophilia bacterium]